MFIFTSTLFGKAPTSFCAKIHHLLMIIECDHFSKFDLICDTSFFQKSTKGTLNANTCIFEVCEKFSKEQTVH